jgi:copper(I)-binding protein
MIYTVRFARLFVSVLILGILVFVGCQRSAQTPEASTNEEIQIALQPVAQEDTLVVILSDANGAPITDATVALQGDMNHPGMIPVLADAVSDDADGSADGRYTLPFTFTMLGDWIVTVDVTLADGSEISRRIGVLATSDGIRGENVMPMEGDHSEGDHSEDESGSDAGETSHENHNAEGSHVATLHVMEAMARPAPLAGGTGAVYFTIHNGGESAVTLVDAETPAAGAVELHTTINDNGVMRMRQLTTGLSIHPDEAVQLIPGGMHLMLIDLAAPLAEGDTIELTLYFTSADGESAHLTLDVPVVNMDDLPAEGEMEHNH